MSFGNIRIGEKYRIENFGEKFEFQVIKRKGEKDYVVKDIHTLEYYHINDIIKFGKGRDFRFELLIS